MNFRSRAWLKRFAALSVAVGGVSSAPVASAYQTDSVASDHCHEALTFRALASVRRRLETADPLRMTKNERALVRDAPFPVPSGMRDIAAVSLVLGNRDVDLQGNEPDELDHLSPLHGDPDNQAEHCLRRPEHDEPDGSKEALEDCRKFIRAHVDTALDALDEDGNPRSERRTKVDVYLDLRGVVEADLPTYYIEMGRALHAFQDAFSHHYRTEDGMRVTAVLNYVDLVEERLDEAVDGPPHSSPMDQCMGLDEFRSDRLDVAARASAELLSATLTPDMSRAEREDAVAEVLDRYLTFEPGCNVDNEWCNAPEREYTNERGCVCSFRSERTPYVPWTLFTLLGLVGWRRRAASRASRTSVMVPMVGALLCVLVEPGLAKAQDVAVPSTGTSYSSDQNSVVADVVDRDEYSPIGGYLAFSGAVQNSALAGSLGFRYRLSDNWLVGVDGEYNPWIVRRTGEFRAGVVNAYATLIHRIPMKFERINLRTSIHAGVSRLMFDLYGAPEGSVGPYFGFNLLGLDIELSRHLYLVVDPADIAIPIPQTTGVPLVYPQYRFTLGLQLGA